MYTNDILYDLYGAVPLGYTNKLLTTLIPIQMTSKQICYYTVPQSNLLQLHEICSL